MLYLLITRNKYDLPADLPGVGEASSNGIFKAETLIK